MTRSRKKASWAIVLLLFLLTPLFWSTTKLNKVERRWPLQKWNSGIMQVILLAHKSEEELHLIANSAYLEVGKLDQVINDYDPKSEAGRLRLAMEKGQKNIIVSKELFGLIKFATQVSCASSGAFDITVEPLIKLWKACTKQKHLPDKKQIQAAKAMVGWQKISLKAKTIPTHSGEIAACQIFQISIQSPISINLGAFSKGYAVDQIVKFLMQQKISAGMVNMGGDLCCFGKKSWKIGIQDPRISNANAPAKIMGIISVKNKAIATSGDYRRYTEIAGKRYSHIIDPRSGQPVPHSIVSVTVVANQAMIADAYATALCVLPAEEGIKLAEHHHLDALIICQIKKKYFMHQTPGFKRLWEDKPNWVQ